jgi:hypothetical protein
MREVSASEYIVWYIQTRISEHILKSTGKIVVFSYLLNIYWTYNQRLKLRKK